MFQKVSFKDPYFQNLDIVRFLSAIMIVFLHSYKGWIAWNENTFNKYIAQIINNFGIGVDIFFLMSGFLITYLLITEKNKNTTLHIKKFYFKRILRIWPLYFFLIIISPLILMWIKYPSPENYVSNIFFVGNYEIIASEKWKYPFAHFWSICVEMHFYLFIPFLINYTSNKKIVSVIILLILGSIFFKMYAYKNLGWFSIYLNTLSRIDLLLVGSLGGILYSKNSLYYLKLNFLYRVIFFIIFLLILSMEPVTKYDNFIEAGFKNYLYIVIPIILILDYVFNKDHVSKKTNLLNYFGKVSYGIYMYHNFLIPIIMIKFQSIFKIESFFIFILLMIFFTILISVISYKYFESYFLKIKSSLS